MSQIPGISFLSQIPPSEPKQLTGVPLFLGNDNLGYVGYEKTDSFKAILLTASHWGRRNKPDSYLFPVIKGFFDNGGQRCYVIFLGDNTPDTLIKALEFSETLENVDLICAPDAVRSDKFCTIQQEILKHCEKMGDRFAILDSSSDPNELGQQLEELNSSYGALYGPWLKVESKEKEEVPPCGHVAGIYALSDQKTGIHGTPANYPLAGVLDVSIPVSNSNQAEGINWIRVFPGRGIRIWGGKTLSKDSQWQYISVRRLFINFRRWVEFNLAATVFEPNDYTLWIRLKRELTVYCESLHKQGALQGITAQEAYYVKCDADNNSAIGRESGQVIAEIGLAPTQPGEFIQLRLVERPTGITVT